MIDIRKLRVLVEGGDDAFFISHFVLRTLSVSLRVNEQIIACGNKEKVVDRVNSIQADTDWQTLAAIVDVDNDGVEATWARIVSQVPAETILHPPPSVTTMSTGRRFGAWLMLGAQRNDMEGFLADIRIRNEAQDEAWSNSIDSTARLKNRLFADKDQHKAEIRAWLAWQKEPGAPPGLAVSQGAFDLQHEKAQTFATWWRQVLDLPPLAQQ